MLWGLDEVLMPINVGGELKRLSEGKFAFSSFIQTLEDKDNGSGFGWVHGGYPIKDLHLMEVFYTYTWRYY